jgi:hypothetical protein
MELLMRVRNLAKRGEVSPKVRLYLKFKLYNDFYEYLFMRNKILLLTARDMSKAGKEDSVGMFLKRMQGAWGEDGWVEKFTSVWDGMYRNSAAHFSFKIVEGGGAYREEREGAF